jgi:hypothetical protein
VCWSSCRGSKVYKTQFNGVGGLPTHIGFTRITIGFPDPVGGGPMLEEFASYCFLAVTMASLALLCSGLLAFAFT